MFVLKKAIYSLKQSPRVQFDKFTTIVARYGLQQSFPYYSIFVRHSLVGTIILEIYVYHIIVARDDQKCIMSVETLFEFLFSCTLVY